MSSIKNVYRVIRSIIFATVITVASLVMLTYLLLSIPAVQNQFKIITQKELSKLLNAPVEINELTIYPLNELILNGVSIHTPEKNPCIDIDQLAAGIKLWKFIFTRKIEITYAEIIGLDGKLIQSEEGGPLNIQFLIDAFKNDNTNNDNTIEVRLRNVVIRKSKISFDREWVKKSDMPLDINHLRFTDVKADIAIPIIKKNVYKVDLRRLSLKEQSGLFIDALSCNTFITDSLIQLRDFELKLNESIISINNQELHFNGFNNIVPSLKTNIFSIDLKGQNLALRDFAFLTENLEHLSGNYALSLSVKGMLNNFHIEECNLVSGNKDFTLQLSGSVKNIQPDIDKSIISNVNLSLNANSNLLHEVISCAIPLQDKLSQAIINTGFIKTNIEGSANLGLAQGEANIYLETEHGGLNIRNTANWANKMLAATIEVSIDGLNLGNILTDSPVEFITGTLDSNIIYNGKDISGIITADIPVIDIYGRHLENITISGSKNQNIGDVDLSSDCDALICDLSGNFVLDSEQSSWQLNGNINRLNTRGLSILPNYPFVGSLGSINLNLTGNDIDNLLGSISLNKLSCIPVASKAWNIEKIEINNEFLNDNRILTISSDIVEGKISGNFLYKDIVNECKLIASKILPSYISYTDTKRGNKENLSFNIRINKDTPLYKDLNINVIPVKDIYIDGQLKDYALNLNIDAPVLYKGNKYIRNSGVVVKADTLTGAQINLATTLPMKNGYTTGNISVTAFNNKADAILRWVMSDSIDKGNINISTEISRQNTNPRLLIDINNSDLTVNGAKWNMSNAHALYSDKALSIDSLNINHLNQFINISGTASQFSNDSIIANLSDIDLSYIFNTLNINYVTFGGMATGNAYASGVFSKTPYASTKNLKVKNLSYNDALLGDADILGYWDNSNNSVGIGADITDGPDSWAKVKGNIYVTKDSLNLNFETRKINMALIRPFLENVLSKVSGRASANLTLYGTFHDITLTGKAYADTAAVTIGYTNVTYSGKDSVLFEPDKIIIPGFRVYDLYGNSCLFSGTVKHDYFHNANIDFNIRDINNLLCYDTNSKQSQFWYGKIFATGSGRVYGFPGYTFINFNVTTDPNSNFTFVVDQNKTAEEYSFLTFTDKKKEESLLRADEIIKLTTANSESLLEEEGAFELDLGVNVTQDIDVNVIMDPVSGDKIKASGNGGLRLHYGSLDDKVDIYGRYTLYDGNYQFSFQDLILRDFKIKPGSSISFNGDPLNGILNLTAGYRVSASLADLDKSFENDPELQRSTIPVDAILKVTGNLNSPDIEFDLELPTVTSDIERKVRSIISSEEMLNQQVLYLLALNRFYTSQSSDGDLISMASSTLSSQIANIMSHITDKVTLSPSFKSDRSDLSDMEVDIGLSSQLFNNRLLINGNLGYRDKRVSQTNFIGDFDIQYLLTKNGNLRLKAYNHFNDAYYYLKSALTTQGIGIIFRKEFDDPFHFLKRHKKTNSIKVTNEEDSTKKAEEIITKTSRPDY